MSFKPSRNEMLVGIIVLNVILFVMNDSVLDNPKQDYLRSGKSAQEMLNNSNMSITRLPNANDVSLDELLNFDSDCLVELKLGTGPAREGCETSPNPLAFTAEITEGVVSLCYEAEMEKRRLDIQISDMRVRSALTPDEIKKAMSEKTKIMDDINQACEMDSLRQSLTGFQISDDR
ncbi:hypothetical protein [Hellea balneolensis]|uniref:hypothetical protein n=1 Tax=Hellea balneolensis TaxID=287478 RepID=UPI00047BD018|nr:hypothetical protein [Hellea balneolensis]